MKPGTKAYIAQEGGKILSGIVRAVITRPHKTTLLESETAVAPEPIQPADKAASPYPPEPTTASPYPPSTEKTAQEEIDYRWECVMKHLGGASVLLREAFERAIDEGIGEGTAEKIMEAMNEHAGMETDLEKMLAMPDATAEAEKILSGVRAFRRAAWEARITTGGGTKEDVQDALLWNNLLYQEAFANAKNQPGEECIREGM